MTPGPISTEDPAAPQAEEAQGFASRPRRSCRDRKPALFTYQTAGQTHDFDSDSGGDDATNDRRGRGRSRNRRNKKRKKGEKSTSTSTKETRTKNTFITKPVRSVPLKPILEEDAEMHRSHLSPLLGGSEIARMPEFAGVFDFFSRFGRDVHSKCCEFLEKHSRREREVYPQESLAAYDDNRIFSSVFFTPRQLLRGLTLNSPEEASHPNGDVEGRAMAKEEEKAPKEEEEAPEAGSTGVKREPGSEGGLAAESAENDDEVDGDDEEEEEEGEYDAELLADIHVMLLRGIHPRVRLPPNRVNWLDHVARDASSSWHLVCPHLPFPSLFQANDGAFNRSKEEDQDFVWRAYYHHTTPRERLHILSFLCELCCERHPAISARLEAAVQNHQLTKRAREIAAAMEPGDQSVEVTIAGKTHKLIAGMEFAEDMRLGEVYATDLYGRRYWLLNLYPEQGHCFLVRESHPVSSRAWEGDVAEPEPMWEVVCSSASEFLKFGRKHCSEGSHQLFAAEVSDTFTGGEVALAIAEHREHAKRVRAAQQRLRSQLGSAAVSAGFYESAFETNEEGARRSRRRTKAVSYAEMEADFDAQIETAVRVQQERRTSVRSRRPPATRREVLSSWSDEEALPSWDGGGGNDHGGGGSRSPRAPRDSVLAPAPRGMILEDAEDGEIGIEDQGLRVAPGSGGPPSQPSGAPSAATPASSLLRYSPHHSPFRSPVDLLDKDEEAVAGEGEDEEAGAESGSEYLAETEDEEESESAEGRRRGGRYRGLPESPDSEGWRSWR